MQLLVVINIGQSILEDRSVLEGVLLQPPDLYDRLRRHVVVDLEPCSGKADGLVVLEEPERKAAVVHNLLKLAGAGELLGQVQDSLEVVGAELNLHSVQPEHVAV